MRNLQPPEPPRAHPLGRRRVLRVFGSVVEETDPGNRARVSFSPQTFRAPGRLSVNVIFQSGGCLTQQIKNSCTIASFLASERVTVVRYGPDDDLGGFFGHRYFPGNGVNERHLWRRSWMGFKCWLVFFVSRAYIEFRIRCVFFLS